MTLRNDRRTATRTLLGAIGLLGVLGACSPGPEEPVARSGPGEVRVTIELPGDDFGSPEDLAERNRVEFEVARRGLGEVVRAGTGIGRVELAVRVKDVAEAEAQLRKLLTENVPHRRWTLEHTASPDR